MRILVTNDDGIHSPGLVVAEQIARTLSQDVWVVAPENEQSGASHSLTLASPLRLRQMDQRHYAVSGTPTDCVMMACLHLLKDRTPDLVISGVNWGSNLADDVTYSGTIAGAMEGCALGIPSIALSQCYDEGSRMTIDWSAGETHGAEVVRKLVAAGWPPGTLMNVNFPACAAEAVQRHALVPRGAHGCPPAALLLDRPAPPQIHPAARYRSGRGAWEQDRGDAAAPEPDGKFRAGKTPANPRSRLNKTLKFPFSGAFTVKPFSTIPGP